jgi:hypothetical protein
MALAGNHIVLPCDKKGKEKKKETGGTNTSGTVRREIRGKTAGVLENGCEEQAEDERQKERR